MSVPERNDADAIEVNQAEHDRLLVLAELYNPLVGDGFRRTTAGPGDKVIDVGCGVIGASVGSRAILLFSVLAYRPGNGALRRFLRLAREGGPS